MDNRKSIDIAAVGIMVAVCLIWAFQQIGLKSTAVFAAPVLQIGLRSGIAAVLVFALVRARRQRVAFRGAAAGLGALAGLLFATEFFLVGEALKHTSASHVVVFLYTAPIFAALGLHWKLPSERLSAVQWGGIAVATAGIAFAFLAPPDGRQGGGDLGAMLWGDGLALLAGAAWGLTTVLIRTTRLSAMPATHVLFYQLATAFLILTGAAVLAGEAGIVPSGALLLNIAFQAVVVSFLSFLTWFWLLTRYRASQLGVFSFMTPVFGVLLGVLLLDDPLTAEFAIGTAGVVAGILIVSAYPWLETLQARSRHAKAPQ
ncbi:MAG TPA: DMT family transporter [Shinella sp.]|nr:DMT family transporter [Shinella sp.]